MRFVSQKFALFLLASTALGPFAACHALAAPDAPRALTPTIDIDVEDRGPDESSHVARFSMSILDGKAVMTARDGEAHYEIDTRALTATDPSFTIKLRRSEPKNAGDIDLIAGIPQKAGTRVLVAKIERADGHLTSVVAQVR
jgi:hypothetical protein